MNFIEITQIFAHHPQHRSPCSTFTHRVGAGEVVASHHLHVGLLYQGDPELVLVAGVGAQQLSVMIHRQVVVYNHLQPRQSRDVVQIERRMLNLPGTENVKTGAFIRCRLVLWLVVCLLPSWELH